MTSSTSSILGEFSTLLPPTWKTTGKGIHGEDTWPQASIDIALAENGIPRDPNVTGSAKAIAAAGRPYKGSGNHEVSESLVESMRTCDPEPLMRTLRTQVSDGFMVLDNKDETNSPYRGFYERDYCVGLKWAANHRHWDLVDALLAWLAGDWWLLESCEWPEGSSNVYPPGLRYHPGQRPPIFRDGRFLRVLRGETINHYHPQMGYRKGSIMAGGIPVAANVWMALACREAGLLDGLKPKKPKLAHELVVHKDADGSGILAYFDEIGGSDPLTVQATEMRRGWARPRLLIVAQGREPQKFHRDLMDEDSVQ